MNKDIATTIARNELEKYRQKSWPELRRLFQDHSQCSVDGCLGSYDVIGPDSKKYHLQPQLFWDDKPEGDIRVTLSIDDGRFFSSIFRKGVSFILSPSGTFVGETK